MQDGLQTPLLTSRSAELLLLKSDISFEPFGISFELPGARRYNFVFLRIRDRADSDNTNGFMKPRRPPYLVPFALAGLCAQAIAGPEVSEEDFLKPLPIVLTASRLPQPLRETPGSVTVLDEELILATGYRNVARLLRLVPGMQIGQSRGHDQWVTYHGLGIVLPEPDPGADRRALGDFVGRRGRRRRLERHADRRRGHRTHRSGARSELAAYGSNAFLGVVHIRTRHPRAETGSSVGFNAGDGLFRYDRAGRRQHRTLGFARDCAASAGRGNGRQSATMVDLNRANLIWQPAPRRL